MEPHASFVSASSVIGHSGSVPPAVGAGRGTERPRLAPPLPCLTRGKGEVGQGQRAESEDRVSVSYDTAFAAAGTVAGGATGTAADARTAEAARALAPRPLPLRPLDREAESSAVTKVSIA